MTENQPKFSFGYFYLALGAFTGIIVFPVWLISSNPAYDAPNLVALIIEVAIAIAITVTVYVYSKRDQKIITKLVKNIEKLETEQQQFLKEQKEFQERRKNFFLNMIRSYVSLIRNEIEKYDTVKMSLGMNVFPNDQILLESHRDTIKYDLKNITSHLTFVSDVLEPQHVDAIRHLLVITEQYLHQQPSHNAQYHGIIGNIDSLLDELPDPPA